MSDRPAPTRRAVLLGAVAAVVAACRPARHHPPALPASDADEAAVTTALEAERALLAAYDAQLTALRAKGDVPVDLVRAAHAEHVRALAAALGRTPTPTPTPSPSGSVAGQPADEPALRAAETTSAARLATDAIAAAHGGVAALLASIAATHQLFGSDEVRSHRLGRAP